MSYVRIWIHCVWSTKYRYPYLNDKIRYLVIKHIKENAREKGINIVQLNGYHDHLHLLLYLGRTESISDVMHKIKGESSFWINKNKLTDERFEWQDDFYAVSVGDSQVRSLRKYIKNQEQHHMKISSKEELEAMNKHHSQ